MGTVTTRAATASDVHLVWSLINDYAQGHPAENHRRPVAAIREAYFGPTPRSRILLAERDQEPVGFAAWRRVFEIYWALDGGEMDALYVKPPARGHGLAVVLLAAVCADIREQGGQFLRGTYTENVARLYERVAVAHRQFECNLSAAAFQSVAGLAGCGPRDILRGLPSRDLNFRKSV
jgi:GNAT superfamily N-acetyltransferase